MSRYSKSIAALIGGITPAIIIGVLALVHIQVAPTLAAGICTLLSTVATVLAPANAPRPPVAPTAVAR